MRETIKRSQRGTVEKETQLGERKREGTYIDRRTPTNCNGAPLLCYEHHHKLTIANRNKVEVIRD